MPRSRRRLPRSPTWRAAPALRRARILMRFRDLMEAHKKDLARLVSQEHGKTLVDAEGSITRGIEVVEFATGIPHLLKGEFSDNVGTGVDSFSHAPAGRRLRGHHAVQLSGDGADVDVSGRARLRQHVHPQAVGARPDDEPAHGRAAARGWSSRRRLQRRSRRQGGGRRDPRPSGHQGGVLRRIDADRALHLRDRNPPRQARAGARRRQESRRRDARCRSRVRRRRADRRRLRLRGRALHGGIGRGRGRRRRAIRCATRWRSVHAASASVRAIEPNPRWDR